MAEKDFAVSQENAAEPSWWRKHPQHADMLGSFKGVAWRLLEDFPLENIEDEANFQKILDILDRNFKYDDRVQLPNDFEAYFVRLARKPNQTILSFVTDHDEAYRQLSKHKVSLPEQVQGWHLLRKAGLTREQKQMVTLKAPSLEKSAVIESLYLLYGQDYKAGGYHERKEFKSRWHGRGYAAHDEAEEDEVWDDGDFTETGYYEDDYEWPEDEFYDDGADFDQEAGYYGAAGDVEDESWPSEDPSVLAGQFDSAYATYLDARKRFNDLRLSRAYLPVVALTGNQQQGPSSSDGSPGGPPRGKGKGYGSSGRGKGRNIVRYSNPPGKADPRGRAKAAMTCLRCGQQGHWAANCPQGASKGGSSNKRPAPSSTTSTTEGMAFTAGIESALVLFQDSRGHDRADSTMLDPGASAFLSGYGPFKRYVEHLKSLRFPTDSLEFYRCQRRFQFGGDAASVAHWSVMLPVFIDGRYGRIQMYLLEGNTPMLLGRPIMESLGMSMDFAGKRVKFGQSPWQNALIGKFGEYLLPLTADFDAVDFVFGCPSFDLRIADEFDGDGRKFSFEEFNNEERVFHAAEEKQKEVHGYKLLKGHQLKTCEVSVVSALNTAEAYVTKTLHPEQPQSRVLWEVYCGCARTSQMAEMLGMKVVQFSYQTGWDLGDFLEQEKFFERLFRELPDEVLMTPDCKLWSQMQNLGCRSIDQKEALILKRQEHHSVHLCFVKRVYMAQVQGARHAHVEQPRYALSWKTKALSSLPGYFATFDQCQYGAQCLDDHGAWLPVKKATGIQTTKRAVYNLLNLKCPGDHSHCPLEGSVAGPGRRTRFMEDFQPGLASTLAAALATVEEPLTWEHGFALEEEKKELGELVKLHATHRQDALRTVQRLHRNLGHPSQQALVELLMSRGASDEVISAAKDYLCAACSKYKKPNAAAPSSFKQSKEFNEILQADVFFIKLADKKFPVMSLVDTATRYCAATLLNNEQSEEYIRALERCWIRHFGPPQNLITDEGRPWLGGKFDEWTSAHGIHHKVAPGEAHERLAVVERRHAVLRKACELYLDEMKLTTPAGIKEALVYIVPQQNATPSVAGFSPAQWLLGYQPNLTGDLLSTSLNPSHLGGNNTFEEILQRRTTAKNALVNADADRKLRRALGRRYQGSNRQYRVGEKVWFWRDARQADLVKVRWLGPAYVVMREETDGIADVYWLAFKTQLIRCAPHHVRGDIYGAETMVDDLKFALNTVRSLKSRGVTRFYDLGSVNKRSLDDVESDEQMDDPDGELADSEHEMSPPSRRPRLLPPVPEPLLNPDVDVPGSVEYSPDELPLAPPTTTADETTVENQILEEVPEIAADPPETLPRMVTSSEPAAEQDPEGRSPSVARSPMATVPSPALAENRPQLDPATAALYEPANAEDEGFRQRRLRFERQETLSFGPWRTPNRPAPSEAGPYNPGPGVAADDEGLFTQMFQIDDMDVTQIPLGWHMEDGYITLDESPRDYWEVRAGCLVRHHVVPRRNKLSWHNLPKDIPVDPEKLDRVRVTVVKDGNKWQAQTDAGEDTLPPLPDRAWTGITVFQINGATRREMAMYSREPMQGARQTAKDYKIQQNRKAKKDKNNVNERLLGPDERAMFKEAKMKELKSFFDNHVWEFQTVKEASPERTMTSRILLNWKQNEDGTPRAKARLIVRGYTDPDALEGKVDTSSPTTTRLARSCLFSLAATCSWKVWTADVSTAFLQGRPQSRKLWVKLPNEALSLLGADENTRMLLLKPCYGQIDAPRGWYLEAVHRLLKRGLTQHPLDPCCFLIYEPVENPEECDNTSPKSSLFGPNRLCGIVIMHVDDMLGAGDESSWAYNKTIEELKGSFSFREWKDGDSLEYCGCELDKISATGWKLSHSKYLKKVKPISYDRKRDLSDSLTEAEVSQLRGLLGSLQWPSVQSSPHLQASTSLLRKTNQQG